MFDKRILFAIAVIVVLLGTGTYYFHRVENWSYVNSFYFSTMTLTTIGYGDFAPTHDASKIFTAFYALFGVGTMLYILSTLASGYVMSQQKHFNRIIKAPLHHLSKRKNQWKKSFQRHSNKF